MKGLLSFAEFVCGEAARHRVFEPLVADWRRELQHLSGTAWMAAAIRGCFAFVQSLAVCAAIDGAWIPPLRGLLGAMAAMVVAIDLSIELLLLRPLPLNLPRDLSEPMVQAWLLSWAGIVIPPVFLLATFVLRRDPRATFRHALLATVLAGAATTALVLATTNDALHRRYDTFETAERMYQLSLKNDRAGRLQYPGTVVRQIGPYATLEQRRAHYDAYRASTAGLPKDPPPTRRERFAQFQPVALAMIFAVMGWILSALSAPTLWRGPMWWGLALIMSVSMTPALSPLVDVPIPVTPERILLPFFGFVLIMLVIARRRRDHQSRRSR
jgi:hypothetical protein